MYGLQYSQIKYFSTLPSARFKILLARTAISYEAVASPLLLEVNICPYKFMLFVFGLYFKYLSIKCVMLQEFFFYINKNKNLINLSYENVIVYKAQ